MMQVYLDAISESKIGNPQYVLQRSLYVERTANRKTVLKRLDEGWTLRGEFNNGAGYEKYHVDKADDIKALLCFMRDKLAVKMPTKDVFLGYLHFQEFYDHACKPEALNVHVHIWSKANKKPDVAYLEADKAHKLRDFLTDVLRIKQSAKHLQRKPTRLTYRAYGEK